MNTTVKAGDIFRHKVRGTTYVVLGKGRLLEGEIVAQDESRVSALEISKGVFVISRHFSTFDEAEEYKTKISAETLFSAVSQVAENDTITSDDELIIYAGDVLSPKRNHVWTRKLSEFADGRFERCAIVPIDIDMSEYLAKELSREFGSTFFLTDK